MEDRRCERKKVRKGRRGRGTKGRIERRQEVLGWGKSRGDWERGRRNGDGRKLGRQGKERRGAEKREVGRDGVEGEIGGGDGAWRRGEGEGVEG